MSLFDTTKAKILSGKAFALIRLPKENHFFLLTEDPQGKNVYSFTSFDTHKKYELPFTHMQEISFSDEEKDTLLPLSLKTNTEVISRGEYLSLIEKTIRFIKRNKASKIVISREKWISNPDILPIRSFLSLCEKYPDSFCHLSYWNKDEVWLGATPEILGSFESPVFETMSLAGTLPDKDSFVWQKKEFEEQEFVTEYIHEKLERYSSRLSQRGPDTVHFGSVKHLVTHFTVRLKDTSDLPSLIQDLHPTPAVCGIPLSVSRYFIVNEEGYKRDFYTGYISVQTADFEKFFVNLRCCRLYQNGALLFVGGGITSQSCPVTEWKETEWKSRFIAESL